MKTFFAKIEWAKILKWIKRKTQKIDMVDMCQPFSSIYFEQRTSSNLDTINYIIFKKPNFRWVPIF